ncbi:MAG: Sulfate adenylyltransferase [Acidobacteria bacterium]|nr:Sulfate adenylyltransferase [Acidobacteriota bacterium]
MTQTIQISSRALNDLALITTGAFAPVQRFMTFDEALSVVERLELPTGEVWPIPILLQTDDLPYDTILELVHGDTIVGSLRLTEGFRIPLQEWAKQVYGTDDAKHPGVAAFYEAGPYAIAGDVEWFGLPATGSEARSPLFRAVANGIDWLTAGEARAEIERRGWKRVAGFQTRNPIHRAHEYVLRVALEVSDGLLVHPLVGETKADDIPAAVRLRCYDALLDNYFARDRVLFTPLPAWMRYAGPREAVLHAIIRRNYGCTRFIVGRDHAGVGSYYGPYDAQKLVGSVSDRIGIEPIFFDEVFYCFRCRSVASGKTCGHGSGDRLSLSGTEVRRRLREGLALPEEFTRPEVAAVLSEAFREEVVLA